MSDTNVSSFFHAEPKTTYAREKIYKSHSFSFLSVQFGRNFPAPAYSVAPSPLSVYTYALTDWLTDIHNLLLLFLK